MPSVTNRKKSTYVAPTLRIEWVYGVRHVPVIHIEGMSGIQYVS